MAEVEIHTGHGHEIDDFGRAVGVMVGIIGIVLALATISAHRAHSAAIITPRRAASTSTTSPRSSPRA